MELRAGDGNSPEDGKAEGDRFNTVRAAEQHRAALPCACRLLLVVYCLSVGRGRSPCAFVKCRAHLSCRPWQNNAQNFGLGADVLSTVSRQVWVLDSTALPFHLAENYHQFHDGIGKPFPPEYKVRLGLKAHTTSTAPICPGNPAATSLLALIVCLNQCSSVALDGLSTYPRCMPAQVKQRQAAEQAGRVGETGCPEGSFFFGI